MGNNLTESEEIFVEQQRHLPKPKLPPAHLKTISTGFWIFLLALLSKIFILPFPHQFNMRQI